MGSHLVLTQPLPQLVGHPLSQLSRVDEDQSGSVAGDMPGDSVEDLAELVAGDGRLELAVGQLKRQVEAAPMPAVDDRWERLTRPHQQTSRRLDRPDRSRETDAHRGAPSHDSEPLE